MYRKQLFSENTNYDGNAYCDFSSVSANALAGKDIILAIFDSTGAKLLAVSGQRTLTINRSADTLEVTSKDTEGGWKAYIPGMKEWSIDLGGVYVLDDEAMKELATAFNNSTVLCTKVYNTKAAKGMFGGLATITSFPIDAPYDDSVTYTLTLQGVGALEDLTLNPPETDTAPQ